MATPPSDDSRMLFKVIADGYWHDYEQVRSKVAAAVPPGRALRKYQERVEYKRKYRDEPDYDTSASENERIFWGSKACAQVVMTSWRGRGILVRVQDGVKQIRIMPGFASWGLDVEGPRELDPDDAEGAVAPQEPPGDPAGPPPSPTGITAIPDLRAYLPAPDAEPVSPFTEYSGAGRTAGDEVIDMGFLSLPSLTTDSDVPEGPEPVPPVENTEKAALPQNGRSDMALFSESEVRHLIAGEIAKALDEFQVGLQGYLSQQFEQVTNLFLLRRKPRGKWIFDPDED